MSNALPALLADLAGDPELRKEFLAVVWEPRRTACVASLRKAEERGDIRPRPDIDLIIDLFAAPVMFRALFGHRELNEKFVREVVSGVLRGMGAGEEYACAHSG